MKRFILPLIALLSFSLIGCSGPNPYGNAYGPGQAQTIQSVYYGVIVNITPATVDNTNGNNFIGGIAGAAIGGLLGSTVGGGTGKSIATIGGAVLGSYIGSEGANALGKSNGVNLTIKLDNDGRTIAIVQPVDPNVIFQVGEEVQINVQGNSARVTPR